MALQIARGLFRLWLVLSVLWIGGVGITASHVFAQQTFPLLQEGSARTAFVSGAYRICLEGARRAPENANLPPPVLGAFCLCYGRALADVINGAEYEALTRGTISESFSKKTETAITVCLTRVGQRSDRELALITQCLRDYHPEDTDYAAAVVRERLCDCFSEAVTKSGSDPREAMGYCASRL
jgi:hypothetical protein